MSAAGSASSQRENEDTIEQGATPLRLLFDLVFVFAFTLGHKIPLRPPHLDRDVARSGAAHRYSASLPLIEILGNLASGIRVLGN